MVTLFAQAALLCRCLYGIRVCMDGYRESRGSFLGEGQVPTRLEYCMNDPYLTYVTSLRVTD